MNNSIYKSIINAKNGSEIPVLKNGKTIESRYNPDKEAEKILTLLDKKYYFYIILGIGSGILINQIVEQNTKSLIICVETNQDDIFFLTQLKNVKKLKNNSNIIFTDIENLKKTLINNYIPALYGDFKIIEQKNWLMENRQKIPEINKQINEALSIISTDYSTQCHFGKIWQSNIINNINTISKNKLNNILIPDINKTAYIIASGPTLEDNINNLKIESKNAVLFSTDTAYPLLISNNIIPDFVVSIDGQNVSHNHFFINKNNTKKTIFALDLCSSFSIGIKLLENNNHFFYFISGHPLANIINNITMNRFLKLNSGSGTVTITALDLALKLGFKNIKILGADFSYPKNKPYARGTYFNYLFGKENTKINSLEKQFNNLMYRSKLIYKNNKKTTIMLNSYEQSLITFLKQNNCTFTKKSNLYEIIKNDFTTKITELSNPKINAKEIINKITKINTKEIMIIFLPYISWLRAKHNNAQIDELLKLAHSHIVRYN